MSRSRLGRRAGNSIHRGLLARVYATLAAQRATKILGIFARLHRRDGKPQYLRHMPRLWGYLQRSLAHPALTVAQDLVRHKCARSEWVMILQFV